MKKIVNIFLAVLITLFSFPIGNVNVSAEANEDFVTPDNAYKIGYTILNENGKDVSVADGFFIKPGNLLEYEGKTYLQLTVESADMVKKLSNKYGDYILVNEKDGTKTMQLHVPNDLSDMELDMHIVVSGVPGFPGYDSKHGAILTFDKDSQKEVNAENYELRTSDGENGPFVKMTEPEEEDKKEDGDSSDSDESSNGNENGNGEDNEGQDKQEPEKPKYEPAPEERKVGSLISESDADEVYELEFETDSKATAAYLENPVKLLVKGEKSYVQIPINEGGTQFFRSLKFNDEEVIWNSIEEGPYTIQYELPNGIEETIDVSMVIDTGHMVMPHDNIDLSFNQETLNMTKVKDKRVTGDILHEEDADVIQLYEFGTDSRATSSQLENPVKLLVKGEKSYIQIPVNRGGAQYFKSLKFNGEEVIWNSIKEGPYTIQYELQGELEDNIDVSMIIDTGRMIMPHDGIKLWLDNTVSSANLNQSVEVSSNDRIIIDGSRNSLKTPVDLPDGVSVKIKSDKSNFDKYGNAQAEAQELELAGEVYEFIFENLGGDFGNFELVMEYDSEKFNTDEYDIDIYYFNPETKEWEAQKGKVANGQVITEVDHFSTYGVFAKEKPEEDEKDNGKETEESEGSTEEALTPEKASTINYTILNENGKDVSVADGFFIKPGNLLEFEGKTYLQLTVESADMVKKLSNKYGDYILVNEKDGTKTMQLRVPNDLSDMELDMHIVVPAGEIPGFPGYDAEHGAILTFDKDSQKEVNAENYELTASGDKKNGNGPFVEGTEPVTPTPIPGKPTPGKPTPEPTPTPEPKPGKGKVNLTPDKAYEINYTILQENGKDVSVADGFFQKPGTLLEYKGKTYLQFTVESANMVKALSNKYGEYILVSKNKDGSMTMQLRVPNDLSDMKLDMHIVVPAGAIPGFDGYDSKHGAILTFDIASKKEIPVEGLKVAASGDKYNGNGPYVEGATSGNGAGKDNNGKTPGKPELGDNGDNGDKKFGKNGNPQTGDTSQIFFFATLLIASLGVLVLQLRRRLAA